MIQTKKFEITKKEYFTIILKRLLQKQWHVLVMLWALAVVFFMDDEKELFHYFFISFAVLYPIIMVFSYWRFANASQNRIIFMEREHDIFEDRLVSRMGNGSQSSIPLDTFVNAVAINDVYLLYVNKTNSIYFPKRVFKSAADEAWFKKNFFLKIKANRR